MRELILSTLLVAVGIAGLDASAFGQCPFPGKPSGEFSDPSGAEASGLVWLPKGLLVVGDSGEIALFDSNGGLEQSWGGLPPEFTDLEGVTVVPGNWDTVYLLVETHVLVEFDLVSGSVLRAFPLPDLGTEDGLEGVTFLPDSKAANGGIFLVGSQGSQAGKARIYALDLPIASGRVGAGTVLGTISTNLTEVSGLTYDGALDEVFAISDFDNLVVGMTRGGVLLDEWTLPGGNQEGIAFRNGALYIADDVPGQWLVHRYEDFLLPFSPGSASCRFSNGTCVNAPGFNCGGMPSIGTTWIGVVSTSPTTVETVVAVSLNPGYLRAKKGEILVDMERMTFQRGFGEHAFPIPRSRALIGLRFFAQGFQIDESGAATPLNALHLWIGP
jgi:hypothetical protein